MNPTLTVAAIALGVAAATLSCGTSPPASGLQCGAGLADCSATCVDLQRDARNCGTCGRACASNEACVAGACSVSCQIGQTECSGSCRDLMTDVANCGACDSPCAAGQLCSVGSCAASCGTGLTDCGGSCVDVMSNPAQCGTCGNSCAPGEYCRGGGCVAVCGTPGLAECDGSCVDLQVDRSNCGRCGDVCAPEYECAAGACRAICGNGLIGIGEECDGANLGTCGACRSDCRCALAACTFQEAEHPAFTNPAQTIALCGAHYAASDMATACAAGWHVCLLGEWNAGFPAGADPNGALTSWGSPQSARCSNVWEAIQPTNSNVWSGDVCHSPYNPWNNGKFLFDSDGATILEGSGMCCSWDSTFAPASWPDGYAVYCCANPP